MQKLIPIAIIIAGIAVAGALIYTNYPVKKVTSLEILALQEAGEKAINYINENILRGRATASLINVLEENGLYKIKFNVGENEIESYITRDGKLLFLEGIDLTKVEPPAKETSQTIGNFSVTDEEICRENGKPIVYFFGSERCPHCQWEHPIIEKVAKKIEGEISFHNNMDNSNDEEIFSKYSEGSIPTLVLGCKYFRVGSGENAGEEQEEKNLTALICKLTDGKPTEVCSPVQDLINQIK